MKRLVFLWIILVDCGPSKIESYFPTENNYNFCHDGIDNDDDQWTDCDDQDCSIFTICDKTIPAPTAPPNQTAENKTLESCQDGQDNDEDNWVDCNDQDCLIYVVCVKQTLASPKDATDKDATDVETEAKIADSVSLTDTDVPAFTDTADIADIKAEEQISAPLPANEIVESIGLTDTVTPSETMSAVQPEILKEGESFFSPPQSDTASTTDLAGMPETVSAVETISGDGKNPDDILRISPEDASSAVDAPQNVANDSKQEIIIVIPINDTFAAKDVSTETEAKSMNDAIIADVSIKDESSALPINDAAENNNFHETTPMPSPSDDASDSADISPIATETLSSDTATEVETDASAPVENEYYGEEGCLIVGSDDDDQDNDNLTNLDEYSLGTNPCAADTDNDGINDSVDENPTGIAEGGGSGLCPEIPVKGKPNFQLKPGQHFLVHPLSVPAMLANAWQYSNFSASPFFNPLNMKHSAMDWLVGEKTPVVASCDGYAIADISTYGGTNAYGLLTIIKCDQTVEDIDNVWHILFVLDAHLNSTLIPITLESRVDFHKKYQDYINKGKAIAVKAGQIIGYTSKAGNPQWNHLHHQLYLDCYGTKYCPVELYHYYAAIDPYDIYALTTKEGCSSALYYPGNLFGCYFSGCGESYLWKECPPVADCSDDSCAMQMPQQANTPGAYVPNNALFNTACYNKCPDGYSICEYSTEKCQNNLDDDGDGKQDCFDLDCLGAADCAPKINSVVCSSIQQGTDAVCQFNGANFTSTDFVWLECATIKSKKLLDTKTIELNVNWSCANCNAGGKKAAYRHPGTVQQDYGCQNTLISSCVKGAVIIFDTCVDQQCGKNPCETKNCPVCPDVYYCDYVDLYHGYCLPGICKNANGEWGGEDVCICEPNCQNKECGDDGCGGDCGKCSLANANAVCQNSLCQIAQCQTGWADCDAKTSTGCETNLKTLTDCGSCGKPCSLDHAVETCANGTCSIANCESGFNDCNGKNDDGCETALTTLTNCGDCGQSCSLNNADETCANGVCAIANCASGYHDCDGKTANGCEIAGPCAGCPECTTLAGTNCVAGANGIGCLTDNDDCTKDVCQDGICKHQPINCYSQKPNECLDENTLKIWAPQGKCVNGTCLFDNFSLQTCLYGCSSMTLACNDDPCAGIVCNTAPMTQCFSNVLRVYNQQGVCDSGNCNYSYTETNCAFGCFNNQCAGDPCGGVVCNNPPAPICKSDGKTKIIYNSPGVCSWGICNYSSYTEVSCTDTSSCTDDYCVGGDCLNPQKPNSCGSKQCGWSDDGCFSCGTCQIGECNSQGQCVKECNPGDTDWQLCDSTPGQYDYCIFEQTKTCNSQGKWGSWSQCAGDLLWFPYEYSYETACGNTICITVEDIDANGKVSGYINRKDGEKWGNYYIEWVVKDSNGVILAEPAMFDHCWPSYENVYNINFNFNALKLNLPIAGFAKIQATVWKGKTNCETYTMKSGEAIIQRCY